MNVFFADLQNQWWKLRMMCLEMRNLAVRFFGISLMIGPDHFNKNQRMAEAVEEAQ